MNYNARVHNRHLLTFYTSQTMLIYYYNRKKQQESYTNISNHHVTTQLTTRSYMHGLQHENK